MVACFWGGDPSIWRHGHRQSAPDGDGRYCDCRRNRSSFGTLERKGPRLLEDGRNRAPWSLILGERLPPRRGCGFALQATGTVGIRFSVGKRSVRGMAPDRERGVPTWRRRPSSSIRIEDRLGSIQDESGRGLLLLDLEREEVLPRVPGRHPRQGFLSRPQPGPIRVALFIAESDPGRDCDLRSGMTTGKRIHAVSPREGAARSVLTGWKDAGGDLENGTLLLTGEPWGTAADIPG